VPPNRGIYRGAARETLKAEVHTQPATSKAVRLSDDVRPIELQVFAAAPARRSAMVMGPADEQSQQQQQQ
jgi:hypothetical protein